MLGERSNGGWQKERWAAPTGLKAGLEEVLRRLGGASNYLLERRETGGWKGVGEIESCLPQHLPHGRGTRPVTSPSLRPHRAIGNYRIEIGPSWDLGCPRPRSPNRNPKRRSRVGLPVEWWPGKDDCPLMDAGFECSDDDRMPRQQRRG